MKAVLKYIPGFRSDKMWKKVIAIIYYLFCLLMLVAGIGPLLIMLSIPFILLAIIGLIKHRSITVVLTLVVAVMIFGVGVALNPVVPENKTISATKGLTDTKTPEEIKKETDEKAAEVKATADAKIKVDEDAKIKAAADDKALQEQQVKADADAKLKADADAKVIEDAKALEDKKVADAKVVSDAKVKADADAAAAAETKKTETPTTSVTTTDSSVATVTPTAETAASNDASITVYYVPNSKVYHLSKTDPTLKKSKDIRSMKLAEAKANGMHQSASKADQ